MDKYLSIKELGDVIPEKEFFDDEVWDNYAYYLIEGEEEGVKRKIAIEIFCCTNHYC
jgi:hypothetical protein